MDNIPEETAKTLCNVAEVEFQRCIERKNQLENKAGVCIGAMAAILIVLLQSNSLYITDVLSLDEKVTRYCAFMTGIVNLFYLLAMGSMIYAINKMVEVIQVKDYWHVDLKELCIKSLKTGSDNKKTILELIKLYENAKNLNQKQNDIKTDTYCSAIAVFKISMALALMWFVVYKYSGLVW